MRTTRNIIFVFSIVVLAVGWFSASVRAWDYFDHACDGGGTCGTTGTDTSCYDHTDTQEMCDYCCNVCYGGIWDAGDYGCSSDGVYTVVECNCNW
jgi:hypothetical protein